MAKILIIEDEFNTRELLLGILERERHEVYCAENGIEGLEKINSLKPDLIMLDLILPELSGFEILDKLREDDKIDIPVLIISGKTSPEERAKGISEGAIDYITKPFFPLELLARMNSILRIEEKTKENVEYEKKRVKSQIAVTMKHEINNPLAIILAQAELLDKEEKKLSARSKKRISSIIENARRIKRVLSKIEKLDDIKSVNYIDGVDMIDICRPE